MKWAENLISSVAWFVYWLRQAWKLDLCGFLTIIQNYHHLSENLVTFFCVLSWILLNFHRVLRKNNKLQLKTLKTTSLKRPIYEPTPPYAIFDISQLSKLGGKKTVQHKTFDCCRIFSMVLSLASVSLYRIFSSNFPCIFFRVSKFWSKMNKKNEELCFLCKSQANESANINNVQVKVNKNEMISFLDAMQQLTGIDVSGAS